MVIIILSIFLLIFLWLLRDYLYSLLSFLSLRLEGREPDFQILNSLRDDLIHERKKKIASLEMILSTWEKGESISTHFNYFIDLINQLKLILKDQRENLLIISPNPFLWIKLRSQVLKIEKALKKIEKGEQKTLEIKKRLSMFSDEIEEILEKATQKFTFSLNEVIKESVKIVRTEKDRVLKEKGIKIEEKYEEIGERFRLPYKNYKDWQKLICNLVRNGIEAVEQKLQANTLSPLATGYSLLAKVVRIEVRGTREDVIVAVEDNGIGMDEKTRETFYKRGFTQGKETGLGLGITEETIEFINKYGSWNIESKINEGTRVEIKIEKEKARRQDLTIEDRSALVIKLKSRRIIFALAGVLVVVIGLGLYFQFNKYARFWEDWNPAFFDAEANHLIVKNKARKILWDIFLPSRIRFIPPLGNPLVRLSDLDGDSKMEILVGIDCNTKGTGKVICYNYKKEKSWEFFCGESGVYSVEQQKIVPNSGYFNPVAIESEDVNRDSKKEVIISSEEVPWFPDQIAILDHKGTKISEYWHPGVIKSISSLDLDKDGEKEIILTGINNRMGWRPVISVLDPKRVFGQAMPYIAIKRIEKAKEKWYIVFPHIKKKLPDESKWETFLSSVDRVDVFSKEDKLKVDLADGRLYFLNLSFEYNSVYLSKGFLVYKRDFPFPYEITIEDEENWKNIEVYKEGVRIK